MSIDNIIAFLNMCVTTLNDTHFETEGVVDSPTRLAPLKTINRQQTQP
jgi:hypothetical protein